MTHTYVELEVSATVFEEIRGRLLAAGYDPVLNEGRAIDMHGIALVKHDGDDQEGADGAGT